MQVSVLDAKNQLSRLIRQVQTGEEVIIANRGAPVARLLPARPAARTRVEGEFLQWLVDHPLPAHARRDAADIDAAIEAERQGWD